LALAALIVNVVAMDPPPGAGLVTLTVAVPTVATSMAGTLAVITVALTKVVVKATELKRTWEEGTNPVPLTVSVKAADPATTEEGERLAIVGAGLLISKVNGVDVPPPGAGLTTVSFAVPPRLRSVAGRLAWSEVALTNVVVKATPFHSTFDVFTKLVPVTASVKAALPASALPGA